MAKEVNRRIEVRVDPGLGARGDQGHRQCEGFLRRSDWALRPVWKLPA